MAPALSLRERIKTAESAVADAELYGTVERHKEALDLLYALYAERDARPYRIAPITLQDAAASLNAWHVLNGTYERAVATSERRRKHAEFGEWVSFCMRTKSNITLAEWRNSR